MSQSSLEFTARGVVAPTTDTVLQDVTNAWQAAFDNTLNTDAATPQGQLITTQAAIVQDKNAQLLHLANQFDPAQADGIFQDALAAIYFITRHPARATVVQCLCTGLEGTVINGSDASDNPDQVKDVNGNLFACQTSGTIPASGSITLPFAALEAGPLAVEAHSVTRIVQAKPGWDSVDNPEPGIVGRETEQRREFELRRQASVALNSRSMLASVYGAVANLEGVIDALALQNRGDTPKTEGGVTLAPHSVYIAVLGGEDATIAEAMYNHVSGGCDYNGNTAVQHTDATSGAKETVRFQRTAELAFRVKVTLRHSDSLPADVETKIRDNVLADFYGQQYPNSDGTAHQSEVTRIRIGAGVYASRFICPVISAGAVNLISVEIAAGEGAFGNFVQILNNQHPSLVRDAIEIVVEGA